MSVSPIMVDGKSYGYGGCNKWGNPLNFQEYTLVRGGFRPIWKKADPYVKGGASRILMITPFGEK